MHDVKTFKQIMSETNYQFAHGKKIRIAIAEDHISVRKGFIQLLKEVENFKIVGEASNGKELLEILPELSPDILLLDIEMPQMSGKETLQKIVKLYPLIKPVILSSYYSDSFIKEFVADGARAYLSKSCNVDDLISTINHVYQHGFCISKVLSQEIVSHTFQQIKLADLQQLALTRKEVRVLKLICDGLSNKEMAHSLKIDINTVNYHKKNIYKKTKLNSIGPLVKYAIKHGYTDL